MQWKPFTFGTEVYDLSHLSPQTMRFVRAAKDGKPAFTYTVDVTYSLHCFSRSPAGEAYDRNTLYPASELRIFDGYRYEMSKRLPSIIAGLPTRVVRQTGRNNFITVEIIREDGAVVEYDVFFRVKKTQRARLELRVESAYVRDPNYGSNRPAGKRIGFLVILHNTMHSLTIRS